MNIYLLNLVGKWISLAVVAVASMFGLSEVDEKQIQVNVDNNLRVSVINEVVDYDVIKKYNPKIPKNKVKVIENGITGIVQKNEEGEVVQILREVKSEIVEIETGPAGDFSGRITGYGPDCKTCSGKGIVACPTKDKKRHSLVENGIYYEDEEYGKLRIIAADNSLFKCGTVIEITSKGKETFRGIVLDTGAAMRKAWREYGIVAIDIAFETEQNREEIYAITSNNVKFSVERWGW